MEIKKKEISGEDVLKILSSSKVIQLETEVMNLSLIDWKKNINENCLSDIRSYVNRVKEALDLLPVKSMSNQSKELISSAIKNGEKIISEIIIPSIQKNNCSNSKTIEIMVTEILSESKIFNQEKSSSISFNP